jgi:hypothetical protein
VKTLKISIVPTTLLAKINSFLGMSFYRIFIFGKIGLFQWPPNRLSLSLYRLIVIHFNLVQLSRSDHRDDDTQRLYLLILR